MMTRTLLGQYFLIRSLIRISFWWSFGPVWYHPTTLSLAFTFLNYKIGLISYSEVIR